MRTGRQVARTTRSRTPWQAIRRSPRRRAEPSTIASADQPCASATMQSATEEQVPLATAPLAISPQERSSEQGVVEQVT